MSSDIQILTVCDPHNVTVRDLQLTVSAKSITFDIEEDLDGKEIISTSITFDMTCPDHILALKNLIEILILQVKNHEGHYRVEHPDFYQSEGNS